MLSRNAPHYAAELRRNATFRHYDDRYHITAKLVRDAHRLTELLARLAGPLKDVTVGAFSLSRSCSRCSRSRFCSPSTVCSTPRWACS